MQGLASLRNLRTLRCAHNRGITSLDGLGKAGQLEVCQQGHLQRI
jgi:hypothetical protein